MASVASRAPFELLTSDMPEWRLGLEYDPSPAGEAADRGMTDFTYVPLNEVDFVGYDELLSLLEDDDRLDATSVLCFRRDESGSSRPLYYVLGHDELARAKTAAFAEIGSLPQSDLFELLNIHEQTQAETVPLGTEPARRAIALDPQGSVAGVWIEGDAVPALAFDEGPPLERAMAPLPMAANGGPSDEQRGDEAPVTDSFFRKTPHLDLSADEPLAPGQSFQALVYLDQLEPRPGETVRDVVIDLPDDLEVLDIEVMLVGTDHFEVTGESFKTLTMNRDDETSEKLSFDVRVVDEAPLDQPAALTAHFTYNHRPSGRVQRAVDVKGAPAQAPEEEAPPVAHDEVAVDGRALPADITVDVVRTPDNDGRRFLVTVRTTLVDDFVMTKPDPWNFEDETDVMVAGMMSQFSLDSASPDDRKASLEGAGILLWEEAAPQAFKDLFWRLIEDENPPRTIYIASEEPHIPWELMRPHRERADGSIEQRDALGVEFIIGRFVGPGHRSPKQNDVIDASYIVAGTKYIRQKRLKTAADEAKWVADRFDGTIVTPASRAGLDKLLEERAVGLLHFVAHGKSDPKAPQLLVLDDDAIFNSMQVRAMKGLTAACQTKAPLVFLNACEVGRPAPSLVGAGGFASEFIKAGARGVVAPLWSVKDSLAHEVAVDFYQAALDKPQRPFADILREIRAKSYAEGGGEDTYAAYCFYGDPLTSLKPPE